MRILLAILILTLVLSMLCRVTRFLIRQCRKPFKAQSLLVQDYGDEVGTTFSCRAITWLTKFNEVLEYFIATDLILISITSIALLPSTQIYSITNPILYCGVILSGTIALIFKVITQFRKSDKYSVWFENVFAFFLAIAVFAVTCLGFILIICIIKAIFQ